MALIQPMDQDVFETLKRLSDFTFQNLSCLLSEAVEGGQELTGYPKRINLQNIVFWMAQLWNEMKPETFVA